LVTQFPDELLAFGSLVVATNALVLFLNLPEVIDESQIL
jgi:hypothetical protein